MLQNAFSNLALDATLLDTNIKLEQVLDELSKKLEAGDEVALNSTTLSALESISTTISNFPTDFPDANVLAKLEAIRILLAGTLSTNGLTDAQLRATALSVSLASLPLPTGAATDAKLETIRLILANQTTGLTDSQLRATALLITASSLPLPSGASTENTLAAIKAKTDNLDVLLSTRTKPTDIQKTDSSATTQPISAVSLPIPVGAATEGKQDTANTLLTSIATEDFATQTSLLALIAKIVQGTGAASTAQLVTLANENVNDLYVTGQSAQTAIVNNILTASSGTTPTDVQAYRSFNIQVVSTGTGGTFIFEGSNDGTNFQSIPIYNQALVVRIPIITAITATSSQIIYEGSCNFRYLRLRIVSTITGGSIQAFSTLIQTSLGTTSQVISNGTAANFQATVSGSLTSAGTTTNTPVTPTASIVNSAATTNGTVIKASAGTLYSITVSSTRASTCYLKFHNSATITAGTTSVALTIAVPTNSTITVPFGATGMRFGTGICLSITGAAADNDTTSIGLGEAKVLTAFI